MTVHFGIDLGTTYSTVAASRNGRVELLSLGTRSAAVPSVVFVRDDGPPLVGEAAEARAQGDPSRFAREFKRRLGDPTPLVLGGVPMGAERLSADVLGYLVQRATERVGEAPASIVLTHPASYTQYRLDLLGEAVNLAGLHDVRLLAEPRAAAIHYASDNRVQDGETVAVYDFGGGTFDAALVRRRGDDFELIGEPQGIDRFGGIDIDLAVFDYVTDEASDLVADLDGNDPVNRAMLARLRADCRQAKERLSADTETVVGVATSNGTRDIAISRRLLESMIRFRLADTVQALERAVRSAGLEQSDVSRVLLVGGSSRIPLVRTLLTESFRRPVSVDADPESTIALGAAAAAGRWAATVPAPAADAPVVAPGAFAAPMVAATPEAPPTAPEPAPDPEPVPNVEAAPPPEPARPPDAPRKMVVPTPPPPPSHDGADPIPPMPGARSAADGSPPKRRKALVVAIAAVLALIVAGVVVVLATRSSDDGKESDSSTVVAGVGFSDDVKLNPPDGFTFQGMTAADLSNFSGIAAAPAVGGGVALLRGAKVVDDDGSVPASVVRFVGGNGDMPASTAQAVVDTVLGQGDVDPSSKLQHSEGDIGGTLFSTVAGGRGFVAPFDGGVLLVSAGPDGVAKFDDVIHSLARANGATSSDTTGSDATTSSTGSVQVGDIALNPPDGLHFGQLPVADLEAIRALVAGAADDSLQLIQGSALLDEQSSTTGSVFLFQSGGGELSTDASEGIINAILEEESVTDTTELSIDGISGTKFTTDDGTVGWIGEVAGAVVMMTLTADAAQFLEQDMKSLAANNPQAGPTTTTATTPTTVTFDIVNVSIADLNSTDPTINPPAGFHFEPLNSSQQDILRTAAALVGPTATSLHTVLGSPLYPDDGSPPPGGIIMYLGDGTPQFQQQIADALITDGSAPIPFQVGSLVGTLFTRGDGTQGWVGPYHDSAILVSIDTVDPDHVALKAVLEPLAAANP